MWSDTNYPIDSPQLLDFIRGFGKTNKKTLMVGLRGIASYGSVMQGKNGEVQASGETASDKAVFLPVFAPAAP